MNQTTPRQPQPQRLGKRVGLTPYYIIAEHTATRLVLETPPRANRQTGYLFFARGAILSLLALFVLCSGYFSLAQNVEGAFGGVVLATLCGGVLGGLGFAGLIGGLGILNTSNTIEVDTTAQFITYTQRSRVLRRAQQRQQRLPIAAVRRVCLRERPVAMPGLFRRQRQITLLELVTTQQGDWIVDSASTPEGLLPTATALAEVLGHDLELEAMDVTATAPEG